MSRGHWKHLERDAAALVGGQRYPANQGGRVDVESDGYVVQTKERGTLSLRELETLALELERIGFQRPSPKLGIVIVKRSAGRGAKTPRLVVMTEAVFRAMSGPLPTDPVA